MVANGQAYVAMAAIRVNGTMTLIAPVNIEYNIIPYTIFLKLIPKRSAKNPADIRVKPELAFAMEMK